MIATFIHISGYLMILLAFIHLGFSRRFSWTKELAPLSLINRQVMYVHTFFIAFTILLMGALCIHSADSLSSTPLGRIISLGFFIFWFTRLVFQFFVYSPALWKGKRFETWVHILFIALWTYLSAVFFAASGMLAWLQP